MTPRPTHTYIIGSRGSDLALWQARHVQKLLKDAGITTEIKIIKTQGDKIQELSFDKMEGKGFFTKELEEALLKKEIDLAVHSHKDLPTTSPNGLVIAAVSSREDASEYLIVHKASVDIKQKFALKKNAVVGTSSARRKAQLLAFRPDVVLKDLRGNVPTRIAKLREHQYDAVLIAAAGIERLDLNLDGLHVDKISLREIVPAPAQGALALQVRGDDTELIKKIQIINDSEAEKTIAIERKVLNLFDGGCQLPLGVYCEKEEDIFRVWAAKATAWDKMPVRVFVESKKQDTIADAVVRKLTSFRKTSVFITRDRRKNDFFFNVLEGNGYPVSGHSLIETNPVALKPYPETDWIFFSSKNAVRFFFEQARKIPAGIKYGAIGKATADEIRKYGKRADFIGYSVDSRMTGKQFAATVKNGTVLFPQAKDSMRSIQLQFANPKQLRDLIVYETIRKEEKPIPDAEVLVFTSPSNVEAYLKTRTIKSGQTVIAMGKSTGKELETHGCTRYRLPYQPDEVSLSETVFGI